MVFIVKIDREDLEKIRGEVFEGNKISNDEYLIKKAMGGEFLDIEILKIVD